MLNINMFDQLNYVFECQVRKLLHISCTLKYIFLLLCPAMHVWCLLLLRTAWINNLVSVSNLVMLKQLICILDKVDIRFPVPAYFHFRFLCFCFSCIK